VAPITTANQVCDPYNLRGRLFSSLLVFLETGNVEDLGR
jgi:hypothetical protein